MKKYSLIFILFLLSMFCLPFTAMAKQSYDFSDVEQPFLTFPFEVVSVDVSGEAPKVLHNYHIAASFDDVINKFSTMYDKKQTISEYFIIGMTKQSGVQMYQIILAYQNEHHYAQVQPDGSGTLISVEATPVSYVTGIYPIAVYGFTMPDGGTATVDQFKDE